MADRPIAEGTIRFSPDMRSLANVEKSVKKAIGKIEGVASRGGLLSKNYVQPLGQITGAADEFTKSLEASNARVIAFGASAGIIYNVQRALTASVAAAINLEKQLADINVILNETNVGLRRFGEELFSIAKNTGQTFNNVSEAALEFARQGLAVEETLKRTRDAMILVRLSGLDVKSSVESITATLNSFNQTVINSTELVNKLANVDAAFAVSSADLAEAIRRVGSSAQDSNVNIDQLIALVTTAQQVTARGGSVIGNSLKTIFTRLQRPQVIADLESFGIAVKDQQGAMLDTMTVLQNFANTYEKLQPSQKAVTAELVGGVFQINVLKAALGDLGKQYSIYDRALNVSLTSTDQAIARNELLNKTLSTLINETLVNVQKVGAAFANLTVTPALTNILEAVNSSVEKLEEKASQGDLGVTFGKGILQGLSNVLSGPALVAIAGILGKLTFSFFKFSSDAVKTFAGLNTTVNQQKEVQSLIQNLLIKNPSLIQSATSSAEGLKMVENEILKIVQTRNVALSQSAEITSKIAANMSAADLRNATKGTGGGAGSTFASGFVPNYNRKNTEAEVMGALQGGYMPGKIDTMQIQGVGRVTYNQAETVKQFPGMDQPAIIPPRESEAGKNYEQRFKAAHGFNPYHQGMIPNFNKGEGIRVIDGDTMEAMATQAKSYRLSKVDAAESSDTVNGSAATRLLENSTLSKKERFEKAIATGGKAAYGRGLFVDERFQRDLVKKGLGVPDLRYASKDYLSLEVEDARKNKRGIWKNKNNEKALQYDRQFGLVDKEKNLDYLTKGGSISTMNRKKAKMLGLETRLSQDAHRGNMALGFVPNLITDAIYQNNLEKKISQGKISREEIEVIRNEKIVPSFAYGGLRDEDLGDAFINVNPKNKGKSIDTNLTQKEIGKRIGGKTLIRGPEGETLIVGGDLEGKAGSITVGGLSSRKIKKANPKFAMMLDQVPGLFDGLAYQVMGAVGAKFNKGSASGAVAGVKFEEEFAQEHGLAAAGAKKGSDFIIAEEMAQKLGTQKHLQLKLSMFERSKRDVKKVVDVASSFSKYLVDMLTNNIKTQGLSKLVGPERFRQAMGVLNKNPALKSQWKGYFGKGGTMSDGFVPNLVKYQTGQKLPKGRGAGGRHLAVRDNNMGIHWDPMAMFHADLVERSGLQGKTMDGGWLYPNGRYEKIKGHDGSGLQANGLVPNFAQSALGAAIGREMSAGYSRSQVKVGYDSRLAASGGIGVYNAFEGSLGRAINMHRASGKSMKDLQTQGASHGYVPNYATDAGDFLGGGMGLALIAPAVMSMVSSFKEVSKERKEEADTIKKLSEAVDKAKISIGDHADEVNSASIAQKDAKKMQNEYKSAQSKASEEFTKAQKDAISAQNARGKTKKTDFTALERDEMRAGLQSVSPKSGGSKGGKRKAVSKADALQALIAGDTEKRKNALDTAKDTLEKKREQLRVADEELKTAKELNTTEQKKLDSAVDKNNKSRGVAEAEKKLAAAQKNKKGLVSNENASKFGMGLGFAAPMLAGQAATLGQSMGLVGNVGAAGINALGTGLGTAGILGTGAAEAGGALQGSLKKGGMLEGFGKTGAGKALGGLAGAAGPLGMAAGIGMAINNMGKAMAKAKIKEKANAVGKELEQVGQQFNRLQQSGQAFMESFDKLKAAFDDPMNTNAGDIQKIQTNLTKALSDAPAEFRNKIKAAAGDAEKIREAFGEITMDLQQQQAALKGAQDLLTMQSEMAAGNAFFGGGDQTIFEDNAKGKNALLAMRGTVASTLDRGGLAKALESGRQVDLSGRDMSEFFGSDFSSAFSDLTDSGDQDKIKGIIDKLFRDIKDSASDAAKVTADLQRRQAVEKAYQKQLKAFNLQLDTMVSSLGSVQKRVQGNILSSIQMLDNLKDFQLDMSMTSFKGAQKLQDPFLTSQQKIRAGAVQQQFEIRVNSIKQMRKAIAEGAKGALDVAASQFTKAAGKVSNAAKDITKGQSKELLTEFQRNRRALDGLTPIIEGAMVEFSKNPKKLDALLGIETQVKAELIKAGYSGSQANAIAEDIKQGVLSQRDATVNKLKEIAQQQVTQLKLQEEQAYWAQEEAKLSARLSSFGGAGDFQSAGSTNLSGNFSKLTDSLSSAIGAQISKGVIELGRANSQVLNLLMNNMNMDSLRDNAEGLTPLLGPAIQGRAADIQSQVSFASRLAGIQGVDIDTSGIDATKIAVEQIASQLKLQDIPDDVAKIRENTALLNVLIASQANDIAAANRDAFEDALKNTGLHNVDDNTGNTTLASQVAGTNSVKVGNAIGATNREGFNALIRDNIALPGKLGSEINDNLAPFKSRMQQIGNLLNQIESVQGGKKLQDDFLQAQSDANEFDTSTREGRIALGRAKSARAMGDRLGLESSNDQDETLLKAIELERTQRREAALGQKLISPQEETIFNIENLRSANATDRSVEAQNELNKLSKGEPFTANDISLIVDRINQEGITPETAIKDTRTEIKSNITRLETFERGQGAEKAAKIALEQYAKTEGLDAKFKDGVSTLSPPSLTNAAAKEAEGPTEFGPQLAQAPAPRAFTSIQKMVAEAVSRQQLKADISDVNMLELPRGAIGFDAQSETRTGGEAPSFDPGGTGFTRKGKVAAAIQKLRGKELEALEKELKTVEALAKTAQDKLDNEKELSVKDKKGLQNTVEEKGLIADGIKTLIKNKNFQKERKELIEKMVRETREQVSTMEAIAGNTPRLTKLLELFGDVQRKMLDKKAFTAAQQILQLSIAGGDPQQIQQQMRSQFDTGINALTRVDAGNEKTGKARAQLIADMTLDRRRAGLDQFGLGVGLSEGSSLQDILSSTGSETEVGKLLQAGDLIGAATAANKSGEANIDIEELRKKMNEVGFSFTDAAAKLRQADIEDSLSSLVRFAKLAQAGLKSSSEIGSKMESEIKTYIDKGGDFIGTASQLALLRFDKTTQSADEFKRALDLVGMGLASATVLTQRSKKEVDTLIQDAAQNEGKLGGNKSGVKKRVDEARTALVKEQRAERIALEAAQKEGIISTDKFREGINKLNEEMIETGAYGFDNFIDSIGSEFTYTQRDFMKDIDQMGREFGRDFKTGVAGAFGEAIRGTKTLKQAFSDMMGSMADKLLDKSLNMATNAAFGAMGFGEFNKGGLVKGYSKGGSVVGGSGVKDDVPAYLSRGEYVIRRKAVSEYGKQFFDSLNGGKVIAAASGGSVNNLTQDSANKIFGGKARNAAAIEAERTKRINALSSAGITSYGYKESTGENKKDWLGRETSQKILASRVGFKLDFGKPLNEDRVKKIQDAVNSYPEVGPFIDPDIFKKSTVQIGRGATKAKFKNSFIYNETKRPDQGRFIADPRLSTLALNDENDPQNKYKFEKADKFFDYQKDRLDYYADKQKELQEFQDKKAAKRTSFLFGAGALLFAGGMKGFAKGGQNKEDDIPALLTGGEYVMRKGIVDKYGLNFFENLNRGRISAYNKGGYVAPVTGARPTTELQGGKSDSGSVGLGSTTNNISISVNVENNGAVTAQANQDGSRNTSASSREETKELAERVKGAVIGVIAEQKRPGGMLYGTPGSV